MEPTQTVRALGLMSGTSMDGIDLALIETDGESLVRPLAFASIGYDEPYRERLRQAMAAARGLRDRRDRPGIVAAVEREITERHAAAVASVRAEPRVRRADRRHRLPWPNGAAPAAAGRRRNAGDAATR